MSPPREGSAPVEVPHGGDPARLPARVDLPEGKPRAALVLAHGAGAGMEHPFMTGVARRLADRGVAVLRWQFPYMALGKGRPDRPAVAVAAVAAAVEAGRARFPGVPLFAGGKSFGGRMTSTAASEGRLEEVGGLVFFGFPLHAAGKPSASRGEHLARVEAPLLFLQGTRDALAELELLRPVVEGLGERATLHQVEGADHGFHVLKRSGRTDEEVLDELAERAASWMATR